MTTTCSTWYVENFEVVGVSRMSQVVLSSSGHADLDGRAVCAEKQSRALTCRNPRLSAAFVWKNRSRFLC